MAESTKIAWTDSTYNSWWGCLKVSPACLNCYAESTDKRAGGAHWGAGVPRRLISESARNEPYRWQRKADEFFAKHGRDRRVFTLSMGDLLDKEVPDEWRGAHMWTMQQCDRLKWQICTKRIGNLTKMVPATWRGAWPRHIGVLITVINQAEADRDIPKLLEAKKRHGIPWVGISYEPAQGPINFAPFLDFDPINTNRFGAALDWVIFGGESGGGWRPADLAWARRARDACAEVGTAFFFKQIAAFRPREEDIPEDLRIRQFPAALC